MKSTQNIILWGICFFITGAFQCNSPHQTSDMQDHHDYTNELINETSPYLLQHAHNPVNWYPWGDKALAKAKEENKPIIISVGYAACHWCHVMEHESFEDTSIAKIMNEHFVCIKVDREERPDIDQVYMTACQLMNNRGGWPLNAIALPDGRPFFAGTYYPKEQWSQILEYFSKAYTDEYDKILDQASRVTQGVKDVEMIPLNTDDVNHVAADLDRIFDNWEDMIDFKDGGRAGAPKFPMPNNYQYLLRYHHATNNEKALEASLTTLNKMAWGGIYDHMGGGFARYSVDGVWKVPHFEKMMYDNGQLVSLYSEAYQLTKDKLYQAVVEETLEWVQREMTSSEGGFYSSLDADSEGEEGKFYIFTEAEIDSIVGGNTEAFKQYYSVSGRGNWEHSNILHRKDSAADVMKKHDLSEEELTNQIAQAKQKLMQARENRIRPGLDDKILTSWNALMLKGYVDAYRAFDREEYLEIALKNANFISDNLLKSDYRLDRNYKNGASSINAFLDDYALLIEAFVGLYQVTFDEQWLNKAKGLADYAILHFYDSASGMFFYTSDLDDPLIARKMEVNDNVIPASNSSMAKACYLLGLYFYDNDYLKKADQMLNNVKKDMYASGPWYSNWCWLLYYKVHEPYEVAIVGENWKSIRKELDQHYLPNVLLLGGAEEGNLELLKHKMIEGQTTIYVCQNKMCKLPVTETTKALDLIE